MANKLKSSIDAIGAIPVAVTAPAPTPTPAPVPVPHDVDAHPRPVRLTVWGTLVHELGAAESDQFVRQAKQLQSDSKLESLRHNQGLLNGASQVRSFIPPCSCSSP